VAAERIAGIKGLERLGASVHLAHVDVADESRMREFLETYEREGWPAIRGVVHAAGVVQYQSILEHDLEAMKSVFRPKVVGATVLDRLFSSQDLDFFVLFSSASAILSSPMMTSYAAANAFLDALARRRRASGRPALSINWGSWSDVGMATRFARGDRSAAAGTMPFLSPAEGLTAFERVMGAQAAQIAVMPIDWNDWRKRTVFQRDSLLANFMQQRASREEPCASAITAAAVLGADQASGRLMLEAYLGDQLRRAIGVGSLDPEVPVVTLGFDSLMAVELKNQIEADLRVIVPMVQLVQGPSARDLAGMLLGLLEASAAATPKLPLDARGTGVAEVPVMAAIGQGTIGFEEGEL
jgi:hypothetical protein